MSAGASETTPGGGRVLRSGKVIQDLKDPEEESSEITANAESTEPNGRVSPMSGQPEDEQEAQVSTGERVDIAVPDGDSGGQLRVRTAVGLLFLIFAVSLAALTAVYFSFPTLDKSEAEHIKFPKDIDDAKQLGLVLSRYKDKFYPEVLAGVFVTYLFLQTFAIPGSIFLSIVSGYLFAFPVALLLICFCSATGASFCYLLSYLAGKPLVHKYLPDRAADWSRKVYRQKNNIFSYIVFLRITPFLPNWFINIVSPVIGVRLPPFWIGTFVGVAPPSFIAIQAGTTLQQLTSGLDALTFQSVALLVVFAFLSILPVFLRNRKGFQSYFAGRGCSGGDDQDEASNSPAAVESSEDDTKCPLLPKSNCLSSRQRQPRDSNGPIGGRPNQTE